MVDECYAEIYHPDGAPPPSILQIMQDKTSPMRRCCFHSLSKRSNLPGLRSGFVAGGISAMRALSDLRQIAGPQCPLPAQAAAALAWDDDAHVADNRRLYAEKFDLAETVFADAYDFQRPAAGFFLCHRRPWRSGSIAFMARTGGAVLPGAYLAADEHAAHAAPYIRVALVANMTVTQAALQNLKTGLDDFSSASKGSAA